MQQNVAFVIEYNGAGFSGWQQQPGLRTIQAELRSAMETVLRHPVGQLTASGRTDSGVHARAQVINVQLPLETELQKLSYAVSCILRSEVSIKHAVVVPDSFNACRSALTKEYNYTLLVRNAPPALDEGFVWHHRNPFSLDELNHDAELIRGVRDFSSFRGQGCAAKSPIREVLFSQWEARGEYLVYRVIGRGFLKQMIRNLVGAMIDRQRGKLKRTMEEVFEARDRRCAGITAPAAGLTLSWVSYGRELDSVLQVKPPEWVYDI
jgi:tRNA pseudouridine38-40 synthase